MGALAAVPTAIGSIATLGIAAPAVATTVGYGILTAGALYAGSQLLKGGKSSDPQYQQPLQAPSTLDKESPQEKRRLANIARLKEIGTPEYTNPLATTEQATIQRKSLLGG